MATGLGLLAALLVQGAGCRGQQQAETTSSVPDAAPRITVRDGKGLLFTFFDRNAQMRTVERISDVQNEARKAVMVTNLSGSLSHDRVYVTDLTAKTQSGTYSVWVEERGAWLDRVMPRASVAKIAPTPPRKLAHKTKRKGQRKRPAATQAAAQDTEEMPKIVMFSTSWCPSCKVARQYFAQKGVRFVDLNVEENQAAAQKMVEIQQARGMKVGAVPLIIVGNQVYQGFSQVQIEAALAQLGQESSAG